MPTPTDIQFYPLGDSAIVINVGCVISKHTSVLVRKIASCIDTWQIPGIIEYVPAFTTITVYYDPSATSYEDIMNAVYRFSRNLPANFEGTPLTKTIPVWYNGPDLPYVSSYTRLSQEDVIRIHSERTYLVYMVGFTPGFPYLGVMDKRLATPRKEVPRIKVAAGSVGIAGEQTGVYPMETPGGWQIIGQTPLKLFDTERDTPAFLKAGDQVQFTPIDFGLFMKIKENGH